MSGQTEKLMLPETTRDTLTTPSLDDDECGWQFIVVRPDGCQMYSACFDTAVRWARILAQIWERKILCRFVGERDEYPTYDMLKVSFYCDGEGEFHYQERDGLYYDVEPGGTQ